VLEIRSPISTCVLDVGGIQDTPVPMCHAAVRYELSADDGNMFLVAMQLKVGGREDVGAAAEKRDDFLQSTRKQLVAALLNVTHGGVAQNCQEVTVFKKHYLDSAVLVTSSCGFLRRPGLRRSLYRWLQFLRSQK
jgi:hypothetical protein